MFQIYWIFTSSISILYLHVLKHAHSHIPACICTHAYADTLSHTHTHTNTHEHPHTQPKHTSVLAACFDPANPKDGPVKAKEDVAKVMVLCQSCARGCHLGCCNPKLTVAIPKDRLVVSLVCRAVWCVRQGRCFRRH